MHRTCDRCGRGPLKGNSRSHSNIASRKWQKLNLQKKTLNGVTHFLCTRCLRSMMRQKAA